MACHGDSPKGLVKIIVFLYATTFKTSQNISECQCELTLRVQMLMNLLPAICLPCERRGYLQSVVSDTCTNYDFLLLKRNVPIA